MRVKLVTFGERRLGTSKLNEYWLEYWLENWTEGDISLRKFKLNELLLV
jgi:hypothetical protein